MNSQETCSSTDTHFMVTIQGSGHKFLFWWITKRIQSWRATELQAINDFGEFFCELQKGYRSTGHKKWENFKKDIKHQLTRLQSYRAIELQSYRVTKQKLKFWRQRIPKLLRNEEAKLQSYRMGILSIYLDTIVLLPQHSTMLAFSKGT